MSSIWMSHAPMSAPCGESWGPLSALFLQPADAQWQFLIFSWDTWRKCMCPVLTRLVFRQVDWGSPQLHKYMYVCVYKGNQSRKSIIAIYIHRSLHIEANTHFHLLLPHRILFPRQRYMFACVCVCNAHVMYCTHPCTFFVPPRNKKFTRFTW